MPQDYSTYLSPFTWRYASQEMRQIWSEVNKRRLWRELWVALAEVQSGFGLVSSAQVEDLRQHAAEVDVERALAIESEIHHDLMAELKTFAEQAPLGGKILHLGATSMDIEDNADVLRIRQALGLVQKRLKALLLSLAEKIDATAGLPVMAFTHLQPAEPTTLGYRLAQVAQDLLLDWEALGRVQRGLKGKGFKGAVGTSASYAELLGSADLLPEFETRLSTALSLAFFPVSTQVYPRKQDYAVLSALAGLGGSLYKFAFDLRLLQSPAFGELSEPFGARQVGSSAMPFKRNPINAEKIDSLARALAQMPRLAWDNAAHSLLERTLDDSANRRTLLPEAFLTADELLLTSGRIVRGLVIQPHAVEHNFTAYAPFAAVERVLMALGKAGADRQAMHERLRLHALEAWGEVQAGRVNPLADRIAADPVMLTYLPEEALRSLMDASVHLGDAPVRARQMAATVRSTCT
ncbi:MAG: adenylosuccinate lyase [Anaerolineales bacterium]|jgi:adenylosuccinate lyase|nr:adenylosuccinate lyase [Anaerolineales bacterium]